MLCAWSACETQMNFMLTPGPTLNTVIMYRCKYPKHSLLVPSMLHRDKQPVVLRMRHPTQQTLQRNINKTRYLHHSSDHCAVGMCVLLWH